MHTGFASGGLMYDAPMIDKFAQPVFQIRVIRPTLSVCSLLRHKEPFHCSHMPTMLQIPPHLLTPLQKSLSRALITEKSISGRALRIRGVLSTVN